MCCFNTKFMNSFISVFLFKMIRFVFLSIYYSSFLCFFFLQFFNFFSQFL